MDQVSLVETVRHKVYLRSCGLELPQSSCAASEQDLVELNLQVVSGETGWNALCAFHALLEAPEDAECWNPGVHLNFGECFDLVLPAMSNTWRRLVMPYESLPWALFRLVKLDADAALVSLEGLLMQTSQCSKCQDISFSKVVFDYVLRGDREEQLQRMQEMQSLLRDVLRDLPASTIQVEKLHANVQVVCRSDRAHAPRQKTVHQNTYIMVANQQHASLKSALEDELLGDNRGKVMRLLSSRVVQSSAPTSLSLRKVKKNQVKTRHGLADGIGTIYNLAPWSNHIAVLSNKV